jgi:serine/threonine-protein kinase
VSDLWAVSLRTGERKLVLRSAATATVLDSGVLLAYRLPQNSIIMHRFDPVEAEVLGEPRVVRSGVAAAPRGGGLYAVSRTGTLVFTAVGDVSAYALNTVLWVDRSGKTEEVVTEPSSWRQPRLSPDGQTILLRRVLTPDCDLWSYDLRRGTLSRVSFQDDAHDPLWSPDGRSVIYAGDSEPTRSLYRVDADGTGAPELFVRAEVSLRPASWSADGRRLALAASSSSIAGDIWVLDLEHGKDPEPFLDSRFSERFPSLSPDGGWLVYASDESGRTEVYARPYPGPGGRVQISVDGGTEPLWSRDGSEIFFKSQDMYKAVAVTSGDELEVGEPVTLFKDVFVGPSPVSPDVHSYDVSADGSALLVVRRLASEESNSDLRIVVGWADHLDAE